MELHGPNAVFVLSSLAMQVRLPSLHTPDALVTHACSVPTTHVHCIASATPSQSLSSDEVQSRGFGPLPPTHMLHVPSTQDCVP